MIELERGGEEVGPATEHDNDGGIPSRFSLAYGFSRAIKRKKRAIGLARVGRSQSASPGVIAIGSNVEVGAGLITLGPDIWEKP